MGPEEFPSFEIQATRGTLAALSNGLDGFAVLHHGVVTQGMWVRGESGRMFLISVDARDLRSRFEVFALAIESLEELHAKWEGWQPPKLPEGVPENFRRMLTTRPPKPMPPGHFKPWPLDSRRIEILRRAEVEVEDVAIPGATFGSNPVLQYGVRPGSVPADTSVWCEVAIGLLFSDDNGRRFLAGVSGMAMGMVVTEDRTEVEAYLVDCEAIVLEDYLERFYPGT